MDKDQLLQERQLLHDILVKREAVCLGVLGLYDVRNLMAILGKGLDVINLLAAGLADGHIVSLALYAQEASP